MVVVVKKVVAVLIESDCCGKNLIKSKCCGKNVFAIKSVVVKVNSCGKKVVVMGRKWL